VALFARVSPSQQMRDLRATSGKLPHEKYGKFSSTGLRHFGAKNRISTDRRIGVRGPPIEKKCRRPTTWSELSGGPQRDSEVPSIPSYMAILPVGGSRSMTLQNSCISSGVPKETRKYFSIAGMRGATSTLFFLR
jgi:hypothetical protein